MLRSRNIGLRLLALALVLACAVCIARPLSAAANADQTRQSLIAYVYYTPYNTAAVIGQMEDGAQVTVLGETGHFYKVDCYDMNGYIPKTQITQTQEGQFYISCDPASAATGVVSYTDHTQALQLRHSLLALAQEQLGDPYVYGSARPGGFDCSGLMYYLYGQYGIDLNRTASAQMANGIIVAKEGLQVGDLIFFREPGEYSIASHVGIYAGNNQIIHSGSDGVEYADLDFDYFAKYYLCARRIVNTNSAVAAVSGAAEQASELTAAVGTGRRSN